LTKDIQSKITILEKEKALDNIFQSPEFIRSENSRKLLQYLFDASLKGESKKEITIALEFFNKDSKFDPSEDPSIRVYISKLRKKIDYFYKSAGINEVIRLQIPKGHYDVSFEKVSSPSSKKHKSLLYFSYSIIIVLLILLVFLWFGKIPIHNENSNLFNDSPIWSDFLQNEKPTLLVLGDYYFLYEYSQEYDQRLFIRNPKINSSQDLSIFLNKYKNKKNVLHPLEFTYLRPSNSLSLLEILPIFSNSNTEITLKLASELTWSDIDNSNVIYIGPFKSMWILMKLMEKINLSFYSNPLDDGHGKLLLSDDTGKIINEFEGTSKNQEELYRDYGIISKIKGSKNNSILFLMGFDELAIMKAVRTVTDPNFEVILKNDLLKDDIPKQLYFNLIFETEGFRRTDFVAEVKYFELFVE